MQVNWQDFLSAQGILGAADDEQRNFGDVVAEVQAAATGNALYELSHLGLLQVEGADATAFLQGQFTNDIKALDGSNSQLAGYCNPKGRMLALFTAFAHHDHLHLQLDGRLREAILKRLRMYVMRSKVTLTDVSESVLRIAVSGPDSAAALENLFARLPQQPGQLVSLEHGAVLRLAGDIPAFQIFSDAEHMPAIWQALRATHRPVGRNAWEWLQIQAGIPDVVPATQEAFVPQMLNLDALDGISLTKGCYTGQEIVARTHYLGKVKRRTLPAHLASDSRPIAGTAVQDAAGNEAGMVVRSAQAPQGGHDVLVEVRLEAVDGGLSLQQQVLSLGTLPYALPSRD
ncbi:CAF17-like 4Fe-4S cluster assembly/insertion protein YgfZ [Methylobacillus flagellatus]|uniref:CAF17-like 4Fe-4S cluster assembly/insertion protein YgfZ n=1 Tax=Methylobacillus flagellatus TaxID=405 RepID=UPI0010F908FC|nr:folate-binding protein YgfZ [Methylobacillus flagellatus]